MWEGTEVLNCLCLMMQTHVEIAEIFYQVKGWKCQELNLRC